MAKLERRFYVPEHLHPAMRFDIYSDNWVIMFVYGVEVDRKKLRRTLDHDILEGFAEKLADYGIGIAPKGELGELRRKVEEMEKRVKRIEKGK